MQNNDPRYVRSRLKLRAALLEIADEDTATLSVSAICDRTRVDRATFYRHFEDLDGLVVDTLESLAEEGQSKWIAVSNGSGEQYDESLEILRTYLENVVRHWSLYRWALGPTGSARVIHSLLTSQIASVDDEMTKLYGRSADTNYRSWYVGGGLLGTLMRWLQADEPDRGPDDMARWILQTSSLNAHLPAMS